MRRRLAAEGGYTVPELLVCMAILGIVLTGFSQVLMSTSKTSNRVTEQALLQNEVRVVVDRLTTDLRSATNANGTSPVESLSSTTLQFVSPDTGTPFHLRRIAYRLVSGQLDRSQTYSTDTDGWPWVWPATPGPYYQQLDSITNAAVFTYYDDSGAQTTDPAAVRSVRVSVTVAPKQAQGGSAAYSALVSIRALQ
jgi:prepilin-type N-terminal cleavage/methylation domain-containing protein